MATLAELARFFTRLDARAVGHLQRLTASWGLLADFCFADLLLFGVVGEPRHARVLVQTPRLADRAYAQRIYDALARLEDARVGLAIFDLGMPGLAGAKDLAEVRMRREARTPEIETTGRAG